MLGSMPELVLGKMSSGKPVSEKGSVFFRKRSREGPHLGWGGGFPGGPGTGKEMD